MKWQTIETAPRSGDKYPARDTVSVMLTDGEYIYIGFWNGMTWDDGDYFNDLGVMTHWMPLPSLPETKQ